MICGEGLSFEDQIDVKICGICEQNPHICHKYCNTIQR